MTKTDENINTSIQIFSINVFSKSRSELLILLRNHLEHEKSLLTVMTPNPEQVVMSRNDSTFLDHLQSADVLIPDGVGLVWASKIIDSSRKKHSLTERITGKDVARFLLKYAHEKDITVLIIGGRGYGADGNTTALQPLASLSGESPLNNAFWTEGYSDVQNPTKEEELAVSAAIKKLHPQIVFVAFGAPWQEQWLVSHRELLTSSGVQIGMVVGGAFDVLLGKLPQVPAMVQALGLEWFYRLLREPWRWRRQLKLLEFIKLTIQSM